MCRAVGLRLRASPDGWLDKADGSTAISTLNSTISSYDSLYPDLSLFDYIERLKMYAWKYMELGKSTAYDLCSKCNTLLHVVTVYSILKIKVVPDSFIGIFFSI